MSAVMEESGPGSAASNLVGSLADLPRDVLLHEILSKIDFKDKLKAHQVCKEWSQLLTSGTSTGRHWDVRHYVSSFAPSVYSASTPIEPVSDQKIAQVVR